MKILVGYDGTNAAKEALNLVKMHAKSFGATVDIVTSMEKGTENERERIEQTERGLEWAKSLFDDDNIECNTHLLIRGLAPGATKTAERSALENFARTLLQTGTSMAKPKVPSTIGRSSSCRSA